MAILDQQDEQLVAELRSQMDLAADRAVQHHMRPYIERFASKGPGLDGRASFETASLSLAAQLSRDETFRQWVKSNKVPSSGYACELRLPPSRKAAITGLSPTESTGLVFGAAAMPLRLKTLIPQIEVSSGNPEFVVENSFTPSAAAVAEGALKPALAISFATALARVQTVAAYVKASVQSLADTPQLQSWLDNRLVYSVSLEEENLILNDATNGLMTVAPTFSGVPVVGDNNADVVFRAIGDLMARGFAVDGVVLAAQDYVNLRLSKSSVGTYLFMGSASTAPDDESVFEAPMLSWAIPTVISPSLAPGSFLVGAFQQSTLLFNRQLMTLQISFSDQDDFIRNLCTLRGELRSGIACPVPQGLLKGVFPAAGTASASKR
jgi:hypothetical protein